MSTHDSGNIIRAFFLRFMKWFNCMVCKTEENTGSFLTSIPLIKDCLIVDWKLLHGSIESFMSLARSFNFIFLSKSISESEGINLFSKDSSSKICSEFRRFPNFLWIPSIFLLIRFRVVSSYKNLIACLCFLMKYLIGTPKLWRSTINCRFR